MDALTLTPSAGILRVPSARAGSGGVVEDQVALRARAAAQPAGLERVELLDEASGQRRVNVSLNPTVLVSELPSVKTTLSSVSLAHFFGGGGADS